MGIIKVIDEFTGTNTTNEQIQNLLDKVNKDFKKSTEIEISNSIKSNRWMEGWD